MSEPFAGCGKPFPGRKPRSARPVAIPRRVRHEASHDNRGAVFACSTSPPARDVRRPGSVRRGAKGILGSANGGGTAPEDLLSRVVAQAILAAIHFWIRMEMYAGKVS